MRIFPLPVMKTLLSRVTALLPRLGRGRAAEVMSVQVQPRSVEISVELRWRVWSLLPPVANTT